MRELRDYAKITAAYWAFTLTDGALRMLVLLHLHERGYAPLEIASLFLAYEAFGVVTNFAAGWIGARFGLRSTLTSGLALQVVSCGGLAAFAGALSVPIVLVAQALSGVAKDLTKMSAKSYVRIVVPPGDGNRLLRWVALLTGSKNALKGVGFFLGGVLLATLGFRGACLAMALGLAAALALSVTLPRAAGKATSKVRLGDVLDAAPVVRWLSAARLFLFGARDVWFVLALPIYLASELVWPHARVGGFLAAWVIGYGVVQAGAPAWIGGPRADARRLGLWTGALALPLGALVAALIAGAPPGPTIVVGLAAFAFVFATTSALHSYLVVAYAEGDRVALNVGFYYMANAAGRLAGTLLSGLVFQAAGEGERGLVACLAAALALVVVSSALCVPLRAAERRHVVAAAAGASARLSV